MAGGGAEQLEALPVVRVPGGGLQRRKQRHQSFAGWRVVGHLPPPTPYNPQQPPQITPLLSKILGETSSKWRQKPLFGAKILTTTGGRSARKGSVSSLTIDAPIAPSSRARPATVPGHDSTGWPEHHTPADTL